MTTTDTLLDEARDLRNKKGNLNVALEKVNQALEQQNDNLDVLLFKSIVLRDMGAIVESREVLKHVLAITEAVDKPQQQYRADALRLFGFLVLLQGNFEKALQFAQRAQEIAQTDEMKANTLALLGNIAHTQGNLQEAKTYYEQAISAAQKVRFTEREVTVMINLATVLHQTGASDKAVGMLEEAIKRSEKKWSKALFNAYYEIARMYQDQNAITQDLVDRIKEAYDQARAHGWVDEEGNLAKVLGLLYKEQNQKEAAKEYFVVANKIFSEAGMMHKALQIQEELESLE